MTGEAPADAPQDRLLHITDLHFWEVVWNPLRLLNKRMIGNLNVMLRRRLEYRTERAAEFAEALARTGVKDLFAGGDFSSTATDVEFAAAAEFLRELQRRGLRLYVMPGNHDVYTFEAARNQRFEKHFAEFMPPDGYPCRYTLPGGTPLILAPTVGPNWLSSCGRISDADIDRTLALVTACPPGPILVGAHYPVLHRTETYHSSPTRRLRNAERFRRALGESGREILYIAGHVHGGSLVRDAQYPALSYLTTSALFRHQAPPGPSGSFSEIHVAPGKFTAFRHTLIDQWTCEEM
jgi:hypothetical protein